MFNKNNIIRYERQIPIKNWGIETQQKLSQSKVFIAGAGGLGSPVILYLASAGIGNLNICDNDSLQLHNLNRQIIHDESYLDCRKIDSAADRVKKYNSDIQVNTTNETITDENVDQMIDGCDIIVDCLDNFETRHVLNKAAINSQKPLVHAGIEEFNGQVSFIQYPETACLGCFLPVKNLTEKPNVIGATAGIIGSIQALEIIKYLTDTGELLKNKILFWDGLRMLSQTIQIKPDKYCKVCAKKRGIS